MSKFPTSVSISMAISPPLPNIASQNLHPCPLAKIPTDELVKIPTGELFSISLCPQQRQNQAYISEMLLYKVKMTTAFCFCHVFMNAYFRSSKQNIFSDLSENHWCMITYQPGQFNCLCVLLKISIQAHSRWMSNYSMGFQYAFICTDIYHY